jgi:Mrp family chromosome partitioning ATPase
MSVLDRLARRSLLVVTGKGGVGKTAVAATLGRALAARGRRTLVVEVDPRENLHRMLGLAPSGGAILAAGPRLWVQNLKPRQVLDEVVREQVGIDLIAERVLRSPVYEQFAAGAPGLKEMAILGHAHRLLAGREPGAPELDLVVLDAPASGHGVVLLSAPQLVAEVVARGPFGKMAADLAALIADPARCGVVVVTQAEEMPVEEALELAAALVARIGRPPELLVVNGLYPPAPPAPVERAAEGHPDGAGAPPPRSLATLGMTSDPSSAASLPGTTGGDLVTLWRRRRAINERELAELYQGWPAGSSGEGAARIELPQLPLDSGPALIEGLGACLEAGGLGGLEMGPAMIGMPDIEDPGAGGAGRWS